MSGVFVTFEGPEGAGKTTQIARLADELTGRGYRVTRTREPGGDPFGEQVRGILLNRDASPVPVAELLLFASARAQNVKTVILPALSAGSIVLCDRFTDSTLAYQGFGRGIPGESIRAVNLVATEGLIPDITFLLDLSPEIGLARQSPDAQDRLDREMLSFHRRVREGFLSIARAEPERMMLLDATQDTGAIFAQILSKLLPLLPPQL